MLMWGYLFEHFSIYYTVYHWSPARSRQTLAIIILFFTFWSCDGGNGCLPTSYLIPLFRGCLFIESSFYSEQKNPRRNGAACNQQIDGSFRPGSNSNLSVWYRFSISLSVFYLTHCWDDFSWTFLSSTLYFVIQTYVNSYYNSNDCN